MTQASEASFERLMTWVRWGAAAVAGAWAAVGWGESGGSVKWAASFAGLIAAGNLVISIAASRGTAGQRRAQLTAARFALDALALIGLGWLLGQQRPHLMGAPLVLVPLLGALRYRVRGAATGAIVVGAFLAAHGVYEAHLSPLGPDLFDYLFTFSISMLVAALAGTTEERRHRQVLALGERAEELRETDRLKDRALALVSHEIRGPLAAIVGSMSTLESRGDSLADERRTTLIEMAARQGRHLAALVDDLLVASQPRAELEVLHREWTDLRSVIHQALDAAATHRRNHELEVTVDPLRCQVDPSRLVQVVRNLVENAYKYAPDASIVRVDAGCADGGIFLRVSNAGEEIPAERRAALFEPFTRINGNGKKGIGLGLYVVRRLVEAMAGCIDLESSPARTSFSIWIPCATARLTHQATSQPKVKAAAPVGMSAKSAVAVGTSAKSSVDVRPWIPS